MKNIMLLSRVIPRLCGVARQITEFSTFNKTACRPILRTSWNLKANVIQEREKVTTCTKLPIIYLFTKDGCTLCDEAVEALRPHMHRFILEEVDIMLPENEHWYDLYKYDIPVFHIYEDFLFKHRVDFEALEKGLEMYKDGFDKGAQ